MLDLVTRCRRHIETNKPGRSTEFNRLVEERRALQDAIRELVGKQPDPGAPAPEKLKFKSKWNRFEWQLKSIEERVERAYHRLGEVNSCLVKVYSRVQLLAENLQMPPRWAEALATANQHQSPDLKKLERILRDMLQILRAQRVEQTAALPVVGGAMPRTQERRSPTPLGANIDRLRKECGWSFDELANRTKIDKKVILRHVNEGKGAYPNTLKRYALAFTDALGRPVTVADLEHREV